MAQDNTIKCVRCQKDSTCKYYCEICERYFCSEKCVVEHICLTDDELEDQRLYG